MLIASSLSSCVKLGILITSSIQPTVHYRHLPSHHTSNPNLIMTHTNFLAIYRNAQLHTRRHRHHHLKVRLAVKKAVFSGVGRYLSFAHE